MTEKIDITQKNDKIPEHPEPLASTNTAYDDDDEDDDEQKDKETTNNIITLEEYFEIVMMTSPVAGIKYYMPIHRATNAHVLMIQKTPKPEKQTKEEETA